MDQLEAHFDGVFTGDEDLLARLPAHINALDHQYEDFGLHAWPETASSECQVGPTSSFPLDGSTFDAGLHANWPMADSSEQPIEYAGMIYSRSYQDPWVSGDFGLEPPAETFALADIQDPLQRHDARPQEAHHTNAKDLQLENLRETLSQILESHLSGSSKNLNLEELIAKVEALAGQIKIQIDAWLVEKRLNHGGMRDVGLKKTHRALSGSSLGKKRKENQTDSGQAPQAHRDSELTVKSVSANETRFFFCTVWDKSWKDASGWRRHEAQHYPPWTCMPYNVSINDECCVICGETDTSIEHRDTHLKLENCLWKALKDRSFRDRDKLLEHLRVHQGPDHGTSVSIEMKRRRRESVDKWEVDDGLEPEAFWCGFCETSRDSWRERQEHVLGHIRDGALKSEWAPMP